MAPPYLCQVSTRVSCGACCGLYNISNLAPGHLEALLTGRVEAFARIPRVAEAIEDFGRQQLGWTPVERPFPQFHHCPYVGLIGAKQTRVGCLLHPEVPGNQGRDWRELSYYGAKACQTYLCPTTERLPVGYREILRAGFDHWYLYGHAITEYRLWSAFFEELEQRIGRRVSRADFDQGSRARDHLQHFAALKLSWPFRRADAPGPCHFFFDDALYPRPGVERGDPALPDSPFETIFQELESCFREEAELRRAEAAVARIIEALVATVRI
ncbi:MAG: hypothetical protein QNJ04_13775 [Desulfobacterales bacterium]|nr:hypothetical protein [Desulfobacterales bacterium]